MGDVGVAQAVWLLGQDEQLLRPRVGGTTVAAAAGALIDVVIAGGARWVVVDHEPHVETCPFEPPDDLVGRWGRQLDEAAASGPLPVIHAVNALAPGIWDSLGAGLAEQGLAAAVPRPVRRWLPPRHRPDRDAATAVLTHLRAVISGIEPSTPQDHGVLAVAESAGMAEHLLSTTAFTDSGVIAPTRAFLEHSELLPMVERAVGYLVSYAPVLGMSQAAGGAGAGSSS